LLKFEYTLSLDKIQIREVLVCPSMDVIQSVTDARKCPAKERRRIFARLRKNLTACRRLLAMNRKVEFMFQNNYPSGSNDRNFPGNVQGILMDFPRVSGNPGAGGFLRGFLGNPGDSLGICKGFRGRSRGFRGYSRDFREYPGNPWDPRNSQGISSGFPENGRES